MSVQVDFFQDHVSRYLIEGVPLRAVEVDVLHSAHESAARLQASPTGACIIAQALAVTSLLSGQIKGEERLTVQLAGNGAIGTVLADCNAGGDIRARVQHPQAEGVGENQELQIQSALGEGGLLVIKSLPERELYRGHSAYAHMDLGGALEVYLHISEQIVSRVGLAVSHDGNRLTQARALLIQGLGGGEAALVEALLAALNRTELEASLRAGEPVPGILHRAFPGARVEDVDIQPLRFKCSCSERRVLAMLLALGQVELEDMLEKDGQAQITCEFCMTVYEVGASQLRELLEIARAHN